MNFDNKNFYLAEASNLKSSKKNFPIIFYHIPKCGGTTFCNILHNLNIYKNKKSFRITGPATSFENARSALDNFTNNKKTILDNNYDFIYGHFQHSINNYFKNYTSITILRNPVDRCISHYNMMVRRKVIPENYKIEDCFESKLIPKNIITNIFSNNRSDTTEMKKNNYEFDIQNQIWALK